MAAETSPSAALLRVADGLEKLANSLEEDAAREKVAASAEVTGDPDYGTLGKSACEGADPLTAFLLR